MTNYFGFFTTLLLATAAVFADVCTDMGYCDVPSLCTNTPRPLSVALIAGQSIDVGEITMTVMGSNLVVTYQLTGGWEFGEAQVQLSSTLSGFPMTKKGNPVPGQFEYKSGDISGETTWTVEIPIGIVTCDCTTRYLAAHAAIVLKDGSGTVIQSETAWAAGDRFVQRGSWATFTSFRYKCDCNGVMPPGDDSCETAFGFGDTELLAIKSCCANDAQCGQGDTCTAGRCALDTLTDSRWGWEIDFLVQPGVTATSTIWAGAGGNDLTKGTPVGALTVSVSQNMGGTTCDVVVNYQINQLDAGGDLYQMIATHVYFGFVSTCTIAPGQLGNQVNYENVGGVTVSTFTFLAQTCGGEGHVVAHATVCGEYPVAAIPL